MHRVWIGVDVPLRVRASELQLKLVSLQQGACAGCFQHLQALPPLLHARCRAGYAAQDMRRAFLPAVVSTSGRIHGELLRLLYLLADNKTQRHFRALDEAIDVDSEAYCWRRSGVFWRMRASIGLACAEATTLCIQVFGKARPRSRAGRKRLEQHCPTSDFVLSPHRMSLSIRSLFSVVFLCSFCLCVRP